MTLPTAFDASRRAFVRQTALLGALTGTAAPLALNLAAIGSAAAQSAPDYKALVCLFLFGGNDCFNMVLPTDAASWAAYTATRNQAPDSIALLSPGTPADPAAEAGSPARLGGVLPIQPLRAQGRTFALHPLQGTLRTLFDVERRLAIVPNVGPLIVPATKAQVNAGSVPLPPQLYSHNDQQSTWQALGPEGSTLGWGGRMGDLLASANSRTVFTAISATGNAVFLSGDRIRQYQVSGNGPVRLGSDAGGRVYGSTAVASALRQLTSTRRSGNLLEGDMATVGQRTIDAEELLRNALRPASDPAFGTAPASGNYSAQADPKLQYSNPLTGNNAFNQLAQQLQIVARLIDAGRSGSIGVRRQVFMVSLGGFDTHDFQNRNHADLMARMAHALSYFDTTLGAIGARSSVTTFTASDFGRTFTSNGDGTDHGWGAHHFVMGGAVRGGDLYGRFPVLGPKNANNNDFNSSPDQLGNGSLLPTSSVDQLGGTLGRWFGLSDTQVLEIFPRLINHDASVRNLGFMV